MGKASICVATAVLAVAATAGCSSDNTASETSSVATSAAASATSSVAPASPAQPSDYTAALIKASDIGPDYTAYGQPTLNPGGLAGVGQSFNTADTTRVVVDGIMVQADPELAKQSAVEHNFPKVNAPTPQPFDVGSNGRIATGMSPDNTKAVTEVIFSEGRATVNLVFMSPPDSPPAPDFVLDVARKQDAAVKSAVPN